MHAPDDGDRETSGARRQPRCPTCAKPTDPASRPFCSVRCKEIDLGRWLTGAYVIAGGQADEEDASTGDAAPDADGDTERKLRDTER